MNQSKIGKLIKNIRTKNKLTQKEFAEKLGVTYQAVSKWETGKNLPDIETLKLICDTYNCDINKFLEGNKKIIKSYKIFVLIILIAIPIIYFSFNKNSNYEFKKIESLDENISLKGIIAFSERKTSIYISNIDILNDNDKDNYKIIECSLFENVGNLTKELGTCKNYATEEDGQISSLLKDISLIVDDFPRSCRNFKHNSFFLEINAINSNNKTIKYKVPLKIDKTCH